MKFIKKLTTHGKDVVLYLPRHAIELGWRGKTYIIVEVTSNGQKITITKLTGALGISEPRTRAYGRDRRATQAPPGADK